MNNIESIDYYLDPEKNKDIKRKQSIVEYRTKDQSFNIKESDIKKMVSDVS